MKRATYLGMTPDEAKLHDARREKLMQLNEQLVARLDKQLEKL